MPKFEDAPIYRRRYDLLLQEMYHEPKRCSSPARVTVFPVTDELIYCQRYDASPKDKGT